MAYSPAAGSTLMFGCVMRKQPSAVSSVNPRVPRPSANTSMVVEPKVSGAVTTRRGRGGGKIRLPRRRVWGA
jgi:hypothetical protein